MNAAVIAADCLPRGGILSVETNQESGAFGFKMVATGQGARIVEDVEKALHGEAADGSYDARGVQPFLTYKLAKGLNAGLTMTAGEGRVELVAG
jgi:hypothetical protein